MSPFMRLTCFPSITPFPPQPTLLPYTTLFRSNKTNWLGFGRLTEQLTIYRLAWYYLGGSCCPPPAFYISCRFASALSIVRSEEHTSESSHRTISYAVFCLKKKKAPHELWAVRYLNVAVHASYVFPFNHALPTTTYTLALHDALPI